MKPGLFGPFVKGTCPACGCRSLFLASEGYVTCGNLPCTDPCAASEALGVVFPTLDLDGVQL